MVAKIQEVKTRVSQWITPGKIHKPTKHLQRNWKSHFLKHTGIKKELSKLFMLIKEHRLSGVYDGFSLYWGSWSENTTSLITNQQETRAALTWFLKQTVG